MPRLTRWLTAFGHPVRDPWATNARAPIEHPLPPEASINARLARGTVHGAILSWGGTSMRQAYDFMQRLPDQWSRMSLEQLLLLAALVTLVIAVTLMMSGRNVA